MHVRSAIDSSGGYHAPDEYTSIYPGRTLQLHAREVEFFTTTDIITKKESSLGVTKKESSLGVCMHACAKRDRFVRRIPCAGRIHVYLPRAHASVARTGG
mmetsp:Transcript_7803/g.17732  ORF Transcript_7803/g.17732 Transcript_7803/m.17732 type:complete len:100 (-) Transcript_7803:47-346(-)